MISETCLFQLTAARRRLDLHLAGRAVAVAFQLTAARRRLAIAQPLDVHKQTFQLTAARRRLGMTRVLSAGVPQFQLSAARRRLAACRLARLSPPRRFNSQPPEGGWGLQMTKHKGVTNVSTHSRPKAAGCPSFLPRISHCCFNSQPPEGGWLPIQHIQPCIFRFNSQPPEGGWCRR